jgi:hypothetical protein
MRCYYFFERGYGTLHYATWVLRVLCSTPGLARGLLHSTRSHYPQHPQHPGISQRGFCTRPPPLPQNAVLCAHAHATFRQCRFPGLELYYWQGKHAVVVPLRSILSFSPLQVEMLSFSSISHQSHA